MPARASKPTAASSLACRGRVVPSGPRGTEPHAHTRATRFVSRDRPARSSGRLASGHVCAFRRHGTYIDPATASVREPVRSRPAGATTSSNSDTKGFGRRLTTSSTPFMASAWRNSPPSRCCRASHSSRSATRSARRCSSRGSPQPFRRQRPAIVRHTATAASPRDRRERLHRMRGLCERLHYQSALAGPRADSSSRPRRAPGADADRVRRRRSFVAGRSGARARGLRRGRPRRHRHLLARVGARGRQRRRHEEPRECRAARPASNGSCTSARWRCTATTSTGTITEDTPIRPKKGWDYAESKYAAEQIVLEAAARGLPASFFALAVVYGPHNLTIVDPSPAAAGAQSTGARRLPRRAVEHHLRRQSVLRRSRVRSTPARTSTVRSFFSATMTASRGASTSGTSLTAWARRCSMSRSRRRRRRRGETTVAAPPMVAEHAGPRDVGRSEGTRQADLSLRSVGHTRALGRRTHFPNVVAEAGKRHPPGGSVRLSTQSGAG